MKFTVTKIGENTFPKKDGSGNITIFTVLTDDGRKVKAWKSAWTDSNLKIGSTVEVETEMKKDRDGFDEIWIKAPKGAFTPRVFNLWPQAYQCAIEYAKLSGDKELNDIDKFAEYFHLQFTSRQTPQKGSQAEVAARKPDIQTHPEEKTINVDEIPF